MPLRAAALLVLASAALPGTSALAQSGPAQRYAERYIEVYGNDPCPPSTDSEIVVCARKPEGDRYRIPPNLRSEPGNGPNDSWANKAIALETTGRSGTNSCSPEGGGGWTGCWSKLMEDAHAEREHPVNLDPNAPR